MWMSLLLLLGNVCVDDAPWSVVGNPGNFTKNNQVRMVSEHVDIKLFNDRMDVVATFIFRNGGPQTNVTMAFPDGIRDFKESSKTTGAITRFRTWVDGKQTPAKRTPLPESPAFDYIGVWLKEVTFDAKQSRRVVVKYSAKNGDSGDYIYNYYSLKSGAGWKGLIDKATVRIDWSRLTGATSMRLNKATEPAYIGATLRGQKLSQRSFLATFRSFEPDFQVVMSWAWKDRITLRDPGNLIQRFPASSAGNEPAANPR